MALLAAGLVVGLGLSTTVTTHQALAQAQNNPGNMLNDVGEDEAIYYNAETGRFTKAKVKLSAAHHSKLTGKSKEMTSAQIMANKKSGMVYKKGGKLYLLENTKAAGAAKGTVQNEFQDLFDGNHQY
jgi:hypothetical protein